LRLGRILRREWPAFLLPIIPLALFYRVLFSEWVFWQRDISLYWYPQVEAFVRVVAGGSLPLWNPYMSFGLPFLADPSCQVLYPFTWLNLVLRPDIFYKVYTLFHVTAAGLGLYLLVRRWGLGRLAAFTAGGAWMASGPLLVLVSHYHHLAGTAWLPWVLLALDAALASGTARSAVALGAVATGQVLAGSGDLCLMSAFVAAGYVIAFLAVGDRPVASRLRTIATVTLVACPSAALLSAAQWLPTLGILPSGQRLGLDAAVKMYWSLHPASLIDLWVPGLVSDLPFNAATRVSLFEAREPLFMWIYMGAAAAALVSLSAVLRWTRYTLFAASGLGFSILAALGRHTLLYPLLIRFTPLFLFRYPQKYVILAGFFWAMLVGLAIEGWARGRASGQRSRWLLGTTLGIVLSFVLLSASLWILRGPAVLLGAIEPTIDGVGRELVLTEAAYKCARAGSLAAGIALLAWLGSRRPARAVWTAAAAASLVLADLASVGWKINPAAPRELVRARPALLGNVAAGSRIWVSISKPPEWASQQVFRGPPGWTRQWCLSAGLRDVIWPPTGARWGLRGSYDGDFTGLAPPLLNNLTLIMKNGIGSPLGRRVLQMGGVDYVVGLDEWTVLDEAKEFASPFPEPIRVYRVPQAQAKAYVVHRVRVAAEPHSVELIGDASFDPATEIIIPPGSEESVAANPGQPDSLRELWRRADSIGLDVEAASPGYVVALESFYSGWRARIDGRATEIVRANILFQAVHVDVGRHTVVFEYRPSAVLWGGALSAASAILALTLWRRGRHASRLPPGVAAQ
jgi:hypothetical protein